MSLTIIIVGGVAGGASAAEKARRTNEAANIEMLKKGPYVSFANCGLPYYVGKTIPDRDVLLLQTPERFWKRFRVWVHVLHEVLPKDRKAKCVQVKNLMTQETTSRLYDTLILAHGSGAILPDLPGIHARKIFTVNPFLTLMPLKPFSPTRKNHLSRAGQ